jgi:hypothetical protein
MRDCTLLPRRNAVQPRENMTRALILLLSCTANVALGVWLYRQPAPVAGVVAHSSPPTAAAKSDAPPSPWGQLQSAKIDAEYVQTLRQQGYPNWAIRSLLELRVRERYADRLNPPQDKARAAPFWQTELYGPRRLDAKARAEQRATWREIRERIQAELGSASLDDTAWQPLVDQRRFGSIPADKVSALKLISTDYSELMSQIRERGNGMLLPEDRAELAFLDKEQRADIERLLSPEELDQYDRRNSSAASEIRDRLRHLNPTEDEFLKLYRLQKAFDDRYGTRNLSGAEEDRRRDAQVQLKEQFREALGADRYTEYEIATDGNFGNTMRVVQESKLPRETAWDLVKLQRASSQTAKRIRDDKSLSTEARQQQLSALEASAVQSLTSALGEDGLKRYRGYAGQWLRNLNPPKPGQPRTP